MHVIVNKMERLCVFVNDSDTVLNCKSMDGPCLSPCHDVI